MKKKILITSIILLALTAGAVTYVKVWKSKVPNVSENINIPHFIDTMMMNQRSELVKVFDTTNKDYRLYKLGFTAKSVLGFDTHRAKALYDLYEVYDSIYPNNQFINYKGVSDLMIKYELSIGSSDMFICDIPKNELESIENFNVSYLYDRISNYGENGDLEDKIEDLGKKNGGYGNINGYIEMYNKITNGKGGLCDEKNIIKYSILDMKKRKELGTSFLIIAPRNCFKGEPNVNGSFGTIKDPIVLAPVEGGYIIVTAW